MATALAALFALLAAHAAAGGPVPGPSGAPPFTDSCARLAKLGVDPLTVVVRGFLSPATLNGHYAPQGACGAALYWSNGAGGFLASNSRLWTNTFLLGNASILDAYAGDFKPGKPQPDGAETAGPLASGCDAFYVTGVAAFGGAGQGAAPFPDSDAWYVNDRDQYALPGARIDPPPPSTTLVACVAGAPPPVVESPPPPPPIGQWADSHTFFENVAVDIPYISQWVPNDAAYRAAFSSGMADALGLVSKQVVVATTQDDGSNHNTQVTFEITLDTTDTSYTELVSVNSEVSDLFVYKGTAGSVDTGKLTSALQNHGLPLTHAYYYNEGTGARHLLQSRKILGTCNSVCLGFYTTGPSGTLATNGYTASSATFTWQIQYGSNPNVGPSNMGQAAALEGYVYCMCLQVGGCTYRAAPTTIIGGSTNFIQLSTTLYTSSSQSSASTYLNAFIATLPQTTSTVATGPTAGGLAASCIIYPGGAAIASSYAPVQITLLSGPQPPSPPVPPHKPPPPPPRAALKKPPPPRAVGG